MRGTLWFSKNIFEGGWHVFHFKGGVHMEELTKVGCEGGFKIELHTYSFILSI